ILVSHCLVSFYYLLPLLLFNLLFRFFFWSLFFFTQVFCGGWFWFPELFFFFIIIHINLFEFMICFNKPYFFFTCKIKGYHLHITFFYRCNNTVFKFLYFHFKYRVSGDG